MSLLRSLPLHLLYLRQQIQLYLGLLQNSPRPKTNPNKPSKDDEDDEGFSDDDGEPQIKIPQASQNMDAQRTTPPHRSLHITASRRTHPQVDNDRLKTQEPLNDASKERALDFFENPEKSVAIFLSSYIMTQGFHLYVAVCCPSPPLFDRECSVTNTSCSIFPRMLGFFIKYLIANNVWPEGKASLARSQTPSISQVKSSFVPPKSLKRFLMIYNYAFRDYWNINPDVFYGDAVPDDDSDTEKPEAKRRKVDPEAGTELEQSLKDANVDLIKPEDVDVLMEEATVVEESGGWGSGSKWGFDDGAVPAIQGAWDDPTEQDLSFLTNRPGLMALFGPTALPATHTTGIVEQSMRRIADIIPPPNDVPALPHAGDPSPQQ